MSEKIDVVSFGCRMNLAESQAIREAAAGAGDNIVVVNSCAVTNEATRQARQAIRRLRRERGDAKIIVTGCAAQIEPEKFAAMAEVDVVLGNAEKLRASSYEFSRRVHVGPIAEAGRRDNQPTPLLSAIEGHTRAFLAVQNGCDHSCTFCVIRPAAARRARSRPMNVLMQARKFVETGHKEIVLTGVDLTSWGADLLGAPKLGGLVRKLLRELPELPRLRLSSIDCIEADDELLACFAEEERLTPFLHLSLQAGDDLILKRMKRRHLRADSVRFCQNLREIRPDIALGADLIAGFPTEDEAAFQNTLALIADCGLNFLHIFPFSPRPGAPAAKMPQLPGDLVKARAATLRAAGEKAFADHLQRQIGKRLSLLTERGFVARAADFTPARAPGLAPGLLVEGVAVGVENGALVLSFPSS